MKTHIPVSIVIDTHENRWVGPANKPLKLPDGNEARITNPMILVKSEDVVEAIEAYRNQNQVRVNEILSAYF